MSIILGLLAALSWGVAYFVLRFPTRQIGAFGTFASIQIVSVVLLTVYLGFNGELLSHLTPDETTAWIWAAIIGVLMSASLLVYYHAIEIGVLAVVAPISASYAAVTVLLAFFSGETLQLLSWGGVITVLLGVILTSLGQAEQADHNQTNVMRGAWWAFGSAVGFGISFWALGFKVTPTLGGVIPTWLSRIVAIGLLWGLALRTARWDYFHLPRGTVLSLVVVASVLETAGYVFTYLGYNDGRVGIVSVLSSQFSAVTVLLAWLFLKERLSLIQWCGIGLIGIGNILINL